MLNAPPIKAEDLQSLSSTELGAMVPQLLSYIDEQSKHIGHQRKRLDSAAQAIKWRDAKIEQITFELARLKACLLYTSPSPRDGLLSRMPSSA